VCAVALFAGCGARTDLDAVAAADAAAAEASPPPWTPAALGSRLAFWFDPTSLTESNGTISKWSDLSGNGNDATQPVGAFAPTYDASGVHGLAAATFTGPITFLSIADTKTMRWGTSDCVVLAVIRATPETAPDAMIYQKTTAFPYDGVDLYLDPLAPVPSPRAAAQVSGGLFTVSKAPPATFVDSSVHVVGARRAGQTLEVRVDGAASSSLSNASVASVDVSAEGFTANIGQNGYDPPRAEFQQLHGDIAELIGVVGFVTDAELGALETYLKSRYAIP